MLVSQRVKDTMNSSRKDTKWVLKIKGKRRKRKKRTMFYLLTHRSSACIACVYVDVIDGCPHRDPTWWIQSYDRKERGYEKVKMSILLFK